MSTVKISLLFFFYLLVSEIEIAGAERHDFSACESRPGDRLLTEKSIIRPYKFLGYTSYDMSYSNPDALINCIQVTDQKENDTGGYVSIVSGGVRHNNVTLHFESQFSRGFSFVVKIYGQ
jgi:hypothetical protein